MATQQDRLETVVVLVDQYSRELERYRNAFESAARQVNALGGSSQGAQGGVHRAPL